MITMDELMPYRNSSTKVICKDVIAYKYPHTTIVELKHTRV